MVEVTLALVDAARESG